MVDLVLPACVAGFFVLTLAAAATDIASMTIPNRIPAGLILLFAIAAAMGPLDLTAIGWHVGVGVAVFAATAGLFALGAFGGGDAKLMPSVALWLGPAATADFVLHTAVAGGVLGLGFILMRRLPHPAVASTQPWFARLMDPAGGIPYGIAIAYGAVATASRSPLIASVLA